MSWMLLPAFIKTSDKMKFPPTFSPLFNLNYKAAATGATKQKGNGV